MSWCEISCECPNNECAKHLLKFIISQTTLKKTKIAKYKSHTESFLKLLDMEAALLRCGGCANEIGNGNILCISKALYCGPCASRFEECASCKLNSMIKDSCMNCGYTRSECSKCKTRADEAVLRLNVILCFACANPHTARFLNPAPGRKRIAVAFPEQNRVAGSVEIPYNNVFGLAACPFTPTDPAEYESQSVFSRLYSKPFESAN